MRAALTLLLLSPAVLAQSGERLAAPEVSLQADAVNVTLNGAGFGSNDANVLARLGAVKSGMLGVWETPSASVQSQATSAKTAVEAAVAEANTLMARARSMRALLAANGITMAVPAN